MDTPLQEAELFLRRVLRGEPARWPPDGGEAFEQAFLERSLHHGVQALVFDRVRLSQGWPGWPARIRESLAAALRASAAYDMMRGHEVAAFIGGLPSQGIRCLVIKGDALAHTHYPNPALRTRCDTDLFIHYRDIERMRAALSEAGFSVIPPYYKSHQFQAGSLHDGGAAVAFDIHWRILNAARFARTIDFDEAFDRSVAVPDRPGWRTLDPVDSLLLACLHRAGSELHDPDRLIWLYDIKLLMETMTPAQQVEFAERASKVNVQAVCLDALRSSEQALGTQLPAAVTGSLHSASAALTLSRRFAESNLGLLMDDMQRLPGLRAKSGLLLELFLPRPGLMLKRYRKSNRIWLPLLYLRHIAGGVWNRLRLR